jgi:hypothetical protein
MRRPVRQDRPSGRLGSAGRSSFKSPTAGGAMAAAPMPIRRAPGPVPPEAAPGRCVSSA